MYAYNRHKVIATFLQGNVFTFSERRQALFWLKILPAVVKALSADTEVARIAKYFLARTRFILDLRTYLLYCWTTICNIFREVPSNTSSVCYANGCFQLLTWISFHSLSLTSLVICLLVWPQSSLGSFHCSLLCTSRANKPSSACGSNMGWLVLCFCRLSFYGFYAWHESCSENICHRFLQYWIVFWWMYLFFFLLQLTGRFSSAVPWADLGSGSYVSYKSYWLLGSMRRPHMAPEFVSVTLELLMTRDEIACKWWCETVAWDVVLLRHLFFAWLVIFIWCLIFTWRFLTVEALCCCSYSTGCSSACTELLESDITPAEPLIYWFFTCVSTSFLRQALRWVPWMMQWFLQSKGSKGPSLSSNYGGITLTSFFDVMVSWMLMLVFIWATTEYINMPWCSLVNLLLNSPYAISCTVLKADFWLIKIIVLK